MGFSPAAKVAGEKSRLTSDFAGNAPSKMQGCVTWATKKSERTGARQACRDPGDCQHEREGTGSEAFP